MLDSDLGIRTGFEKVSEVHIARICAYDCIAGVIGPHVADPCLIKVPVGRIFAEFAGRWTWLVMSFFTTGAPPIGSKANLGTTFLL
jgi:hypothetical protein